jgi:cytochrome c551/c552
MKPSGIILVIFLFLFFVSALSANDQGEDIFKSNGCVFCHRSGSSSGTIPSLPELAKAYKGKKEQLIRYFKGEAQSIVKPERAATMKRQIEKTKALSDSERTALVDFILGN